jgi:SNF2 family DNA or RNA helicase
MSFRWMLNGEPRPVQVEALKRSYKKEGWGHFLDMRLGKTATVINEFAQYIHDFDMRYMLVLTPNRFKPDWVVAIDKWGLKAPVHDFSSSKELDVVAFIKKNHYGVVVVNYEALTYPKNVDALMKVVGPDTFIVADESIKLKTPSTSTFKNALKLAKQCKYRRILSGKPITQGPHDLFGQLKFLGELDGWNFALFKAAFCVMGGYQGKQILGGKNEERLKGILDGCSFQARKIDWIKDFKNPDYFDRKIELKGEQARLYKQMQQEFVAQLGNKIVTADQVITQLLKQSQLSSGFIIDESGTPHDVVALGENPKVNAIRQMLEEEIDGKVIVFTRFRHSVDMLVSVLKEYSPALIIGGQNDTLEQKRRFNETEECRVIVCQAEAAKYGHELIGTAKSPCLTAVYFEATYSLDTRSQSEARFMFGDRAMGWSIIDLYCTDLDYKVVKALQRKENVAASILGYDRDTGILPTKK